MKTLLVPEGQIEVSVDPLSRQGQFQGQTLVQIISQLQSQIGTMVNRRGKSRVHLNEPLSICMNYLNLSDLET